MPKQVGRQLASSPSPPTTPRATTPISSVSPRTASGRKAPHCTKCGKPRAGHPRQGCPFDSSSTTPSRSISVSNSRASRKPIDKKSDEENDDSIEDAISRLKLESEEDEKILGHNSVSHNTKRSSSRNQPDHSDRSLGPDRATRPKETRRRSSHKLEYHVTLEAFNSHTREIKPKHGRRLSDDTEDEDNTSTEIDEPKLAAVPLASAASLDRAAFLAALTTTASTPPATVYNLPVPDIPRACKKAQAKGLHTYVVTDVPVRDMTGLDCEHWQVVVGKDRDAVIALGSVLHCKAAPKASRGRASLGAVAVGAAVVGAVATFTGLAIM
jgi:hypothetical protein